MITKLLVVATIMAMTSLLMANLNEYDPWGIVMGFRSARIPYPAAEERVDDIIPLMFFDSKYVFLRGQTGGIKLYNKDEWQFSLIGKYRHFDIPAEF